MCLHACTCRGTCRSYYSIHYANFTRLPNHVIIDHVLSMTDHVTVDHVTDHMIIDYVISMTDHVIIRFTCLQGSLDTDYTGDYIPW